MVFEKLSSLQEKIKTSTKFIQLIGAPGTGSRRLALDFIQPAPTAAWISFKWNLYAPLLWKMAHDRHTRLLGVECPQKREFRKLCKTLLESQIFDAWIFDAFKFTQAEGMFLHKLLRPFDRPSRVLVLDSIPHSFCQERIHFHLSHQNTRLIWSKGRSATPFFLPSPLSEIKENSWE